MDYKSAVNLQGYLQKQSPNLLRNYQKRYFAYRSKGEFLIWFKKKPNSVQDEPKGVIKCEEIDYVKADEIQQRVFNLKYHDRQFVIRAEDVATKDRWVKSIQAVLNYFKKMRKTLPKKIELERIDKGRRWRWEQADQEEIKIIRLQNEKMILAEGEDSYKQNSSKFMKEATGLDISLQFEKNILYGYFNHKGFISAETRWYFICSECNLFDQGDQEFNSKLVSFLESPLQKGKGSSKQTNNKSEQSDSDQQQKVLPRKTDKKTIEINCIYQFDLKSKKLLQSIPFLEIVNWVQNTKESPFFLKIIFAPFQIGQQQGDLDFVQQEKELLLYSNYITEIQKWVLAIKIAFKNYSIAIQRDNLLQKRFVRYKILKFKTKSDQEWRAIGTEAKAQFVYLNREHIKVGGFTFQLQDCSESLKSQKIKQNQEQDKQAKIAVCTFYNNKEKIAIAFANSDDERKFRKRAKKFIKKVQAYLQQQKHKEIKHQFQEPNLNTYYMDKKIRQTSGSIKINFYEVLEQGPSNVGKKKQNKESSFLDRFLSMFCGTPIQQDLYF